MGSTATILHADLDAFYASVEQSLDPRLRGKPIAVGGGVVLAPSYEARAFGVPAACRGGARGNSVPTSYLSADISTNTNGSATPRWGPERFHTCHRAHLHRRGLRRRGRVHASLRFAGRDRNTGSGSRARRARLADVHRVARTKHLAKIASQVAKPDGLVVVDPETELGFLHDLPVALMWGVGPATEARLAKIGVTTIGQLAESSPASVERLLGHAVGRKLTALAWNRDPRHIETRRRAHSAGAQSALGRQPAIERVFQPTLHHLADRIGARLRAKSLAGRTITVRVRFADLRSVTRSLTLSAPISATRALAEVAENLVRGVLADHRDEKTISLLAISVSHLEAHAIVQLELPLGLADEGCRPGTKRAWPDRVQTGPSMRSAAASENKPSITGQRCGVCAPSLTSSDALLKKSCEYDWTARG